jgi:uroporphyrinogen decarboxylase
MTTHRERLQACLAGERPDRTPVALWRHFPVDDQTPDGLAASTLHFQRTYDFDLVKVTPASSFCLKDWGADDTWEGEPEGTRHYTRRVIEKPQDWEKLPALDPSAPHLAGQLACLRTLRRDLGPDVPLLQTIFNPLSQAKNLAGGDRLIVHLRRHPEAVMKGLETIAITTRRFIEAAIETGIDGVFHAVQHAQASTLSRAEYETFGLPGDLQVLEPARGLWCNMLHLHGLDVYFDLAAKLPCQIVNWHDRETDPGLSEAMKLFDGVACGGLSRDTALLGTPAQVQEEAADAIRQTGGKRLILGTGCVILTTVPHGNIQAIQEAAK